MATTVALTGMGRTMQWSGLNAAYAQTNTQDMSAFNRNRRPVAIWIEGIAGGAVLQAQARRAGTSDTLLDMEGVNYTADGVYSYDGPNGIDIDWNITGGTGTIEIKIVS